LPREIHLLQLGYVAGGIDLLPDVAIARIEYAPRRRLPAHAEVETLGLRMVQVVFERPGGGPYFRQAPLAREEQVRTVGAARLLGQRHALGAIVIALPGGEAHSFLARLRIEQAGGESEGDLIRIADAVAAQIPVFGKELRKIEIVDCGIERRYLVLTAVRNVDIVGARFERLRECLAEQIRLALEDQPAVDAADRDYTIQMLFRQRRIVEIVVRHVQTRARGE